jgi:hypothetical protein
LRIARGGLLRIRLLGILRLLLRVRLLWVWLLGGVAARRLPVSGLRLTRLHRRRVLLRGTAEHRSSTRDRPSENQPLYGENCCPTTKVSHPDLLAAGSVLVGRSWGN